MSKSAGTQTTQTITEPWKVQSPYLEKGFERAEELFKASTPNYYPNQTYVPFAKETEQALQLAKARATAGNPLLNKSQTYADNVMSGAFLNPTTNPLISNLFNTMADKVTTGVNSSMAQAGRYGSGAHTGVLADSLGDLADKVYADNYNRERAVMDAMATTAPQLGEMDYSDIAKLQTVGGAREELAERQLADAMQRYEFEQRKPYEKLREYQASVGGPFGTSQSTITPLTKNPLMGLLSGASAGAGIYDMVGATGSANPYLMGGALLGGAGAMFG
tara:strand:+ start:3353 stop:4180 length:828 start_codon:yes stop_codon:yes gene_type:complete